MINTYRLLDQQLYDWRARFKEYRDSLTLQELRLLLLELDVNRILMQTEIGAHLVDRSTPAPDPVPSTQLGLFITAIRARLPAPIVDSLVETYLKDETL